MLEEDGKIYDYKNAIGMVITCDPKRMTDKKCNEKGWNHAYVMMLDSLKEGNCDHGKGVLTTPFFR